MAIHTTALQPTLTGKSSVQRDRSKSLGHGVREAWHQIFRAMFDTYRPELHYMRGPGPACAAKRNKLK